MLSKIVVNFVSVVKARQNKVDFCEQKHKFLQVSIGGLTRQNTVLLK